ncbi:MAG: sugar transferase [Putridiphycobacter sp.]|nr:sugar transferase [Putridiphycobacter sp.]
MSAKKQTLSYVFCDLVSGLIIWTLFFIYRDKYIESDAVVFDNRFFLGLLFVPLFWMLLYGMLGTYRNTLRQYRVRILKETAIASLIGTMVVFFVLLLDDQIYSYKQYYNLLFMLFGLHFILTVIPRFIITSSLVRSIHKGTFGFNTLIIGGSEKAIEIIDELHKLKQSSGHVLKGFVNINGSDFKLSEHLQFLGHIDDIQQIIKNEKIEEVIIALESSDHQKLQDILIQLANFNLKINIIPDTYDILAGQVKMNSIYGALLLEVNLLPMPNWQYATKRFIDIAISIVALILLSPLLILIAILVKISSDGPIFFTQERIGINAQPFQIIKYRTMVQNSEQNGPQLSSKNDARITKVGRFLRKTRIDEFPQFLNVLKGEMSIVGPRPERQFYIDKIKQKDPQYLYLHKVRPGITSWGQVKYGYAENVEEMIQRMKYDLLYIRNMSLALDFKIMFYTFAIILKAKGK